jgi:hypothetical protein
VVCILNMALRRSPPGYGITVFADHRPRTPAIAAGLTDHVWTLREVLLFRVPPWPQPHAV